MKLIMENWNKFQLVTEAQAIHALFESEAITEAEFMDRIKRFAKKKGVPLAVALSLFGPDPQDHPAKSRHSVLPQYSSCE